MPTYDYGCRTCGKEWEEVQRITEPALEVCPHCGKPTAQRFISRGAGFILKGGGWYSDLYSSPKAAASSSESSGESKTSTPAASSGEAKPASTESKPSGGDTKASTPVTPST